MKVVTALALLALAPSTFAGTAESVQFTGFVSRDNGAPFRFDIQVPATKHATIELGDGSKLRLAAPGYLGNPMAEAHLDAASGQALHSATLTDPALASTSLAYRICGDAVTYFNPAPAEVPGCPGRAQGD